MSIANNRKKELLGREFTDDGHEYEKTVDKPVKNISNQEVEHKQVIVDVKVKVTAWVMYVEPEEIVTDVVVPSNYNDETLIKAILKQREGRLDYMKDHIKLVTHIRYGN